ncbi:MAG: arylesterase [Gammaproteobacteria bacterium]|nr:arylesterase [Gammaproteobacteria bacterium]
MRLFLFVVIFALSLTSSAQEKTLMVLGDSISAGYGIALQQGWVHLLEERLHQQGYRYHVKNASISGDTTRGARARLTRLLDENTPDISIIELGGNDGLRGLSLEELRVNLSTLITELLNSGAKVVLVPMRLPPNYGPACNERFEAIYRDMKAEHDITLTRFILEGIAGDPEQMQSDGIHPKASAQAQMLEIVWQDLQPLLVK